MQKVEIGSVRKTHGYAGEIKLIVNDDFGSDLQNANFIFIGKNDREALPYEIKNLRGSDWIIELEGLTSKESAAYLRGLNIYLREEDVKNANKKEEQAPSKGFEKVLGFGLVDEKHGEIASIDEIVEYPQQEMAKIFINEKEILIPLNDELITGIDFIKKLVFMDLPDGILDL